MHGLKAEVAAVEHIGPGGDDAALVIEHRVVEVEAVEIEGETHHCQRRAPDADHRPGGEHGMHAAAVVAGGIGHQHPAHVGVGCHEVVGGLLLPEQITAVDRFLFRGFTHQAAAHQ